MSEANNNAPKIKQEPTPWWQDGQTTSEQKIEPYFLSSGVFTFMQKVKTWLLFPLRQFDALTCSEKLLNYMAWDRNIQRFPNEPLELFRKRVKYAAINAKDAGSVAGFKRIFQRLGVGIVDFKERQSPTDWDVCTIEITDSDISKNSKLVQTLIEQYGRTCRRYRFEVSFPVKVSIRHGEFSHSVQLFSAKLTSEDV
ncbi:phage tail protein [Vibrio cholerae]|uniref:phage tail protein n=1 Tax=Vibrio cholerae TaxID=666 RepID=UPI0013028BED|nr:phage tail protein [Vibrio cholerae]EKF9473134.1 phage tail protein [Vibrio cholerae]EKF9727282.1 phage tail protein [Vibrio cholerae]HCF7777581.1 phage tail protein [Vibrio cholerae]HCF7785281.1 phage tail protein [Vibrio cholerae]